jgi:hypothetical protein
MPKKSSATDGQPTSNDAATVLIEVPVAAVDAAAHRSRFLTMRLSRRQSDALKCISEGLKREHEKLVNERHVDTQPQAVQWLLEQTATAIEGVA